MKQEHIECKNCGLLRSTILETGVDCRSGDAGRRYEHDFGNHGISFPKSHPQDIREEFKQWMSDVEEENFDITKFSNLTYDIADWFLERCIPKSILREFIAEEKTKGGFEYKLAMKNLEDLLTESK